ncbi:MAG: hypothetical protein OEV59_06320 [Deltaproteobacteria bacterium]|nr:hypothetical protein [Deltaproteobacteria bacterium]
MTEYVKTYKCSKCGTMTSGRGHLCHPNPEAGPHKCEYCKKTVTDVRHVCKEMLDSVEYICKKCGRLSAYSSLLCEPELVSGD